MGTNLNYCATKFMPISFATCTSLVHWCLTIPKKFVFIWLCFTTKNLGSDVYTKSRAKCALRQQYHQVCEWTWSTNGLFISCLWPLIHFFGVNLLSLFSKLDVFNAVQHILFTFIKWSGLQKSWIYLHLMIPDNSNNIW